jgi:phenylalanyl-tRNA synthetase beta chain
MLTSSTFPERSNDPTFLFLQKGNLFSWFKRILTDLGFKAVIKGKAELRVAIPSYRQDVKAEIDIIEEIARIFGYEQAPTSLPAVILQTPCQDIGKEVSLVKDILTGLGLNEVITYSLIDRKSLEGFSADENSLVEIAKWDGGE